MANALAGNVWVLDTASTTAVVDSRMPLFIKSIRWDGATTAGHTAVLKDQLGNIFWQSTAAAGNSEDVQIYEGYVNGLIMHTLASGKIILQLE